MLEFFNIYFDHYFKFILQFSSMIFFIYLSDTTLISAAHRILFDVLNEYKDVLVSVPVDEFDELKYAYDLDPHEESPLIYIPLLTVI